MIRINLLPVRAERRRESLRKHLLLLVGFLVAIVAALVSVHLSQQARISSMEQKIRARKAEIARLDTVIKEVQGYNQKIADLSEKIAAIQTLEQRQRGPAKMFKELATLCPEKLWLDKVSDSKGQIKIHGFALDNQTIAKFMTSLDKSSLFTNVRLVETKHATKGEMAIKSFSLTTKISYPKAPEEVQEPGVKKAG